MRGRRQRSNVARSTGRGASVRQGEIPESPHCHRRHLGVCSVSNSALGLLYGHGVLTIYENLLL